MEIINKKLGLATAGVLMGMSMGMLINQHVHADTTVTTPVHATIDTSDAKVPDTVISTGTNPDKGNTSLNMADENAPAPGPTNYSNEGQGVDAQQAPQQVETDKHADSAVISSKNSENGSLSANSTVTTTPNQESDAKNADANQGEGLRIHSIFPDGSPSAWEKRGNVRPVIKNLESIPVGQKYDLTPFSESAWPDYDIMGWRNKDGSPAKLQGVVPKGGLDLYWVVQPTGNKNASDDQASQEAEAWIKKNGIPKDRKNQAYGGKTEQQFWDDFNKAQHDGNTGGNSGTSIAEDPGQKVAKDYKLTFNVLFNGKSFGSESVKGHAGDHYYLQKIGELQEELEKRGLSLTPTSKKLISGEIPDHDMTYNLKVVKVGTVADNGNNNNDSAPVSHDNQAGHGEQNSTANSNNDNGNGGSTGNTSHDDNQDVDDAVDDSFGPSHHVSATTTDNGDTDEEPVASDDDKDDSSDVTSDGDNSDGNNGNSSDNNGQGQASQANQNNQQLPQTGSHRNQLAIIGLGIAMLGAGSIVLLKKRA